MFSREIRIAPFPPCFRQPTTLVKSSGETDPVVWLNDYRLACQLGGATDDTVIIRNLPFLLTDTTRTWLEHLLADQIHNWADLDLRRQLPGKRAPLELLGPQRVSAEAQ